jgi:hypothetical protein
MADALKLRRAAMKVVWLAIVALAKAILANPDAKRR